MREHHLNIVSLDVPLPANYGGVIDIFYKIKALSSLNVKIYLHCFDYGRGQQKDLLNYCEQVTYYKRDTGILSHITLSPYIVTSRKNKTLLKNLKNNKYPILFEGMHSSYYLFKGHFSDRITMLRSHNIEHDYYLFLAKQELNLIKKIFFYKESFLLKRYYNKFSSNNLVAAISVDDKTYLSQKFENTFWLPPFHPNSKIDITYKKGNYLLYHGNLSVSENILAALFIINEFKNKSVSLIIAGKNPSVSILKLSEKSKNISIVKNPTEGEMNELIKKAQIILLPTFQPTGIKLKLLESLFKGKFCIANSMMTKNTYLEPLCISAENKLYDNAMKVIDLEFPILEIEKRHSILDKYYNNISNAKLIIEKMFGQ